VSGQNKGTFIGAVEGNYGEGKTSFLVHVWAKSTERKIFTVPPFRWASLADALEAAAAWLRYILRSADPLLGKKAERLHEEFRRKSLEETAGETAAQTGGDYETILATLRYQVEQGIRVTEVTPERFLNYCARATEIVQESGYLGFLVLLDEPEVAAKEMGIEKTSQLLFDLANLLLERQGNYGILVSMPSNFLASVSARFSALPARLQARSCFPRLRDVYGPDFARNLWARYQAEFELGDEGTRIVSPLALQSIGQVGSSDRSDLSYGPRTVVSAFNQMVYRYRQTGRTYEPEMFVEDCLAQEIILNLDYASKVRQILSSPEVSPSDRPSVLLLAAFPGGLPVESAKQRGIDAALRDLARRGTLVYKTPLTFGLNGLRKGGTSEVDPLRAAIIDVESEFFPNRSMFEHAVAAFRDRVVPLVFEARQGLQLLGWDQLGTWKRSGSGSHVGAFVGSFMQTQRQYPKRAVVLILSSVEGSLDNIDIPELPPDSGPQEYDLAVHFRLRWHVEQETTASKLEVRPGDPKDHKMAFIGLTVDLLNEHPTPDSLVDLVAAQNVTSSWLLNLIHEVDRQLLPKEYEAQWQALKKTMLRDMVPAFFGEDLATLAGEQLGQQVSSSGLGLLGSMFQRILVTRYPTYSTLVSTPRWQDRVDDYIRALKSSDVPLRCKRGRETWKADGELAAKVLGTSRMNLTGGAFAGLENLIEVSSAGRNAPIEIEFHIHPLEQAIADMICSQRCGPDSKLKVEGKECWWMLVDDLLPVIQSSGYTVEELAKIIQIGTARGTFDVMDRKGGRIVYCKPIDPAQMRRQLQDKLDDLQKELTEFNKLPDFRSKLDPGTLSQEIAAVQDEPDYDRLVTRLNKEFEQLHQRLPGYFDRLQEMLTTTRTDVQQMNGQLTGSREVASLKTLPAAKSEWVAKLSRYIVGNLSKTAEERRGQATVLLKDLDSHLSKLRYQPNRVPLDNLATLVEGQSAVVDVSVRAKELKVHTTELIVGLRDYEEWLKLLRRSDEVYEALLLLQSKESGQSGPAALMADYDSLTRKISDHIEVRNVSGLAAHKQFAATLEEIDKKRQVYLSQMKSVFDSRKEEVNGFLAALKLDRRVTATFNPMNSEACYREMFEQAVQHFCEGATGRPLGEIEAQRRELLYARDILQVISSEEAEPALMRLTDVETKLRNLEAKASADWMQLVTDPNRPNTRADAVQTVDDAMEAVRSARQMIKTATRPTTPNGERAKQMYQLIADSTSLDLKDIVLRMMPGIEDATHVLDESLASLVELFRANCIQIRVERRKD
jgi:hypothetical protein